MQITQFATTNTLLEYSMMTTPAPLQVSPQSGPPSVASLSFVISCPLILAGVTVTQITFNLPVGNPTSPDASDLTETATGITPSVTSSGSEQWQIGPGAAAGSFILKPAGGGPAKITSQGLTVTFVGIQISPIVGNAEIDIDELATADNNPPQTRECAIIAAKFPYGFYAGNFSASAPMVQNGGTVVLSWIGSVQATYTLLWSTRSQDVSTVNQWTSPPLTDTTTFILEVVAQQSGQTVKLFFNVTVIVANPNIAVTTLDVLQVSTLEGNVAVGSSQKPANLTVAGAASAASVGISGAGQFGSLAVSGAATAGSGQFGSLAVNGAATAGSVQTPSLTASAATVNGLNARAGRVSMMTGVQGLKPGAWNSPAAFTAPTDGFAIGVIGHPSSATDGCMCWGYGQINGLTVYTTGGNVGFFGPGWGDYMASNPNSFILPVPAGWTFYVAVLQGTSGQQSNAPYWYYWVPMGTGTVGAALVPEEKPGADFVVPPLPAPHRARTNSPLAFITVLERFLDKPIDDVTRQQMLEALGGSPT